MRPIYSQLPRAYRGTDKPYVVIPRKTSTVGPGSCSPGKSTHTIIINSGTVAYGSLAKSVPLFELDLRKVELPDGESWQFVYEISQSDEEEIAEAKKFFPKMEATSLSSSSFPELAFYVQPEKGFLFRDSEWFLEGDSIKVYADCTGMKLPSWMSLDVSEQYSELTVIEGIKVSEGLYGLVLPEVAFQIKEFISVVNPALVEPGSSLPPGVVPICSFSYSRQRGIADLRDLRNVEESLVGISDWLVKFPDSVLDGSLDAARGYLLF